MKKLLFICSILALLTSCAHNTTMPSNASANAAVAQESKNPMSDASITASVKSLFIKKDLFSSQDVASMSIHVETVNKVVYLTGTADNYKQIKNAIRLAKSVAGVKAVRSKVTVKKH